jgi:hypothetical protein
MRPLGHQGEANHRMSDISELGFLETHFEMRFQPEGEIGIWKHVLRGRGREIPLGGLLFHDDSIRGLI